MPGREGLACLMYVQALDNFAGIAKTKVGEETRVLLRSDDKQTDTQRTLVLTFAHSTRLGGTG
jgi:hypothetical protein